MSISKCIVRLKDCHDTEHSVEVYAESLYEAVLRGLGRLEDVGWETNANETIKLLSVLEWAEETQQASDVLVDCWAKDTDRQIQNVMFLEAQIKALLQAIRVTKDVDGITALRATAREMVERIQERKRQEELKRIRAI